MPYNGQQRGGDTMKDEYDFGNAEPGKFYHPDLRLNPPVRLEPEVLDFLATSANKRGATVNQLVNQLLKKDIELIRAAAG
jgi:predicted HicB family RNase H-like nuclease